MPLIQNTQIDRVEVARCTLSGSRSADLDYCVVFVDRVGVLLEHVHGTLKASERFTPNFPVVSPYFAGVSAFVASITTAATVTYNLNRSQTSWEISRRDKTSGLVSNSCLGILVLKDVANIIFEHCSRRLFVH